MPQLQERRPTGCLIFTQCSLRTRCSVKTPSSYKDRVTLCQSGPSHPSTTNHICMAGPTPSKVTF